MTGDRRAMIGLRALDVQTPERVFADLQALAS